MNFDLDLDLANHLADPFSVETLRKENFGPDLIEDKAVKTIFDWQMDHVRQHQQAATKTVLETQFQIDLDAPESAIGDLIERMRRRFVRNKGEEIVEVVGRKVLDDPLSVSRTLLSEGRKLHDLTYARGESFGSDSLDQAINHYHRENVKGRGPGFGFEDIDEHFHGQKGLTFLLGAPKAQKSWLTVNAVLSSVMAGEFPVLYSLELPAVDTLWRFYCLAANVPYWQYLKNKLSQESLSQVEEIVADLKEKGSFWIEKPKPGERSAAQLVERAINAQATGVYIDQLQYVETSDGRSLGSLNDTGAYFEVCDVLKDYSDQIPIWVVHQFNRSVMGIDSIEELAMQQAKGSAAIEETASLQLGIYSNKDLRHSNLLHLGTLASRHFSHATWEVGYDLSKGCSFHMIGQL